MARYAEAIEYDLRAHLGLRLADLWVDPKRWRELLNLIERLPNRCQWRVAAAEDPDLIEAAVAEALAHETGHEAQDQGPRRPDWVTYTDIDARIDRVGFYVAELLNRTPVGKGHKSVPPPLPAETPAQAAVREALDARDDARLDAVEALLGF